MKLLTSFLFLLIGLAVGAQADYKAILADYFDKEGTAGAAIVARGDKILFHGASGKASLELDVDARPEHIFRIGSITKQFTATAILMLQEQGKLSVEDPLTKFLPEYPVGDNPVTIEHLLNHTSGIQSYTDIPGFMANRTRNDMTVDELIDTFKDEPMNFAPGDSWNYNNSGYILLGAVIEKASKMSYEDFIEKNIFERLGMNDSYYDNNEEIVERRVPGYTPTASGVIANAKYISMTLPYAAGSIMSTVEDLYKWNSAVMSGALVSQETLASAFTPTRLNDGSTRQYGYGWSLGELAGKKVIEHGGGIFGFLTQAMYIPEDEVYVAVFSNCNCISPNAAALRMAAMAIGSPLEYEEIEVDEDKLKEYVGVYLIEGGDERRVITFENGELKSQRGSGQKFSVMPYDKDKFFYESLTTLHFERNDEGAVIAQVVTPPTGNSGRATLTDEEIVEVEVVDVDPAVLQKYTGVYEVMPNFDITMTVENGVLVGQATGQGKIPLEAYSNTEFGFPPAGIEMVFPSDVDDKATEFVLKQGGQELVGKRKKD